MKKIEDMSARERTALLDNLYDRYWCKRKGINYSNPNIEKARQITKLEIKKNYRQNA